MGVDESIRDEYGFINTRYSTPTTNPSREESPTYSGYGKPAPDHRRFAIALSELPALNFYNPLLNNPSSSEYIASVRSSIRSIDDIASPHLNMHPRLMRARDSITSVAPYWSQNSVKSIESSNNTSETKNKPVVFSSNFRCGLDGKSFWGFCVSIWTILLLGAAVAAVLYFTGKGSTLFQPMKVSTDNIVFGEFHILNQTIPSEISEKNSSKTFAEIVNQIQQKMDKLFQSSALLSALYNRSVVYGVTPNTPNSAQYPVIRIQFQIHLNHADVMIAEKMANVITKNLHRREDPYLIEDWAINLAAVKFAEYVPASVKYLVPAHNRLASWGQWTEWTPECYLTSCDPARTQSRNRRCLLRDRIPEETIDESPTSRPSNVITPCIAGSTVSAADVEIRPCSCITRSRMPRPRIPFSVVRPTKATHFRFSNMSIAAFDKSCGECRKGEVCVARLEEVVPVCRWAPEPEDPTGCGGFCRAHTEYCVPIGINSFKCEGVAGCLTDSEWRCNDGFCIHISKRCDRDYNCFDHSDEFDCEETAS